MTKTGTPETPPSTQPEAPQEPAQQSQPVSAPKNQLARRVAARISDLEASLGRLLGDDPTSEKRRANIHRALKAAQDSMNLNAERMGPMEAALMSRWLESTQLLVVAPS
jgi:hypothetical protein